MLEAVVEDVQLRFEFLLGDLTGLIATFANDHGNVQAARDQQGFVAEVGGAAIGVDEQNAASFAAVSAGEDVEGNAARFQQHSEGNDEWGFARAADRQISDADDWSREAVRGQHGAVVELVAERGGGAIEAGERVHGVAPISLSKAVTVLSVAPRCDSSASSALRPRVARSPAFSISSMKTSGNSANPTMRAALRLAKKLTTSRKFS